MHVTMLDMAPLGLGLDGWATLAVVSAVTIMMMTERIGPDLVMFGGLALLVISGVTSPDAALHGFAQPATVTIAVLFIVARAIQETGLLHMITNTLFGPVRKPGPALTRLLIPTAALSAVLNNTPIVAMFIPMTRTVARRVGASAGQFLMPLSFAAMLGGTITLIGTSTNLVVSGLLEESGFAPFTMFELTWVGLPTLIVGLAYLIMVAPRLLSSSGPTPERRRSSVKEYMAEVMVKGDSPLVGLSVSDAGLRQLQGLFLVQITRTDGSLITPVRPEDRLRGGDHLKFSGLASTIAELTSLPGIVPTEGDVDPSKRTFEVVVSHNSPLIGRGVRDVNFRRRFGAAILAVHRAGERIAAKIGDIVLQPGDTLMLIASPGFQRTWRDSRDFYLVSEVDTEAPPRYRKAYIAALVLAMMVLLPALGGVSMLVTSFAAVVILLSTQCISPRAAREAVSWPVILLIGAAFGLASAIQDTGLADFLANGLLDAMDGVSPTALLAAVYLIAVVFSSFISNAAAAALLFPIVLNTAQAAGMDPRPFAVTLTMAASAAFATPIGYQTNLLVYGPGGYRYTDFTRVGLPLNVLCMAIAILVIPMVWPV